MKLKNKVVFITGGSSGIGLAIAKMMADLGSTVVICGRSEKRLAAAKTAVPTLHTLSCDITNDADQAAALAEIEQRYGRLDILINNAGMQHNYLLPQESDIAARVAQEVTLNVTALITLTHRALPLLQKSSAAAIVNVGSGTGLMPKPDGLVYSATKAAVHNFTIGLRWQLATQNIHVVELFPPVVDTAMTAGRNEDKVSPDAVAQALLTGLQQNRKEIFIGKMKALPWLVRFAPGIAASIMQKS
ncbi:MAG: SDR family NAD(P)-dependent oxidoreductase [Ardenticatenaceae bacterium]|nr:SDR family NAD(P)-dependent oxidoreductase [Ardenticatenaceae bacterium]